MSEMKTQKPSLRDEHTPKFTFKRLGDTFYIIYDGHLLASFYDVKSLPKGFQDRAMSMFVEMLLGQRTELWDMQAVFGEDVWPTKEQLITLREKFNTIGVEE